MDYPPSRPLGVVEAPPSASPPRLMTGRHPRAVGTYGPALEAWALERPELHPWRLEAFRWWQRLALSRALEHDGDGRLVWRTVVLSGPRQVGKSWLERSVIGWRQHSARVFGRPQDCLHVAHKLQAAQEVWRPAAKWAAHTYGRGAVRWANGEQQIELPDGSRWLIQAATDGAGVAFTLSMALVDEAWAVAPHIVNSGIAPTLAEAEQPQLWLVSTANPASTDLVREYRAQALALEPPTAEASLLLLEWSAPPDPDIDLDDPDVWRAASPYWDDNRALVVAEQRRQVTETDFRSQWLNQWVQVPTAPLFDAERWKQAEWLGALPSSSLVFGADIAGDRSHAVIVAYAGGVVEVVESLPGAGWVAGRLAELHKAWAPVAIGIDGSGTAATIADDLRDDPAAAQLVVLRARDLAAASGQTFDAISEGRLVHRPHADLTAAVSSAKRRAYGQAWAWARQVGDVSGVPLLAVTVALWASEHAPDLVEKSQIW